jgi:tetratricopeptide (TPR) repeat protein
MKPFSAIRLVLLAAVLGGLPLGARAGDEGPGVMDSYRMSRETRSGNESYHQGRYDRARADYMKAKDRAPEKSEESYLLHFNIGSTFYKEGNYEEAEKEFTLASSSADPALREKAFYNLGNVYFKKGEQQKDVASWEKAIEFYEKVLELNPGNEDAKHNIEVIRRLIKKQEEQSREQKPEPKQPEETPEKDKEKEKEADRQQSTPADADKTKDRKDKDQDGKDKEKKDNAKEPEPEGEGKDDKDKKDQADKDKKPQDKQEKKEEENKPDPKNAASAAKGKPDDKKKPPDQDPAPAAGGTAKDKSPNPAPPSPDDKNKKAPGEMSKDEAERLLAAVESREKEDMRKVQDRSTEVRKEKDW